jgi:hypothetical protein
MSWVAVAVLGPILGLLLLQLLEGIRLTVELVAEHLGSPPSRDPAVDDDEDEEELDHRGALVVAALLAAPLAAGDALAAWWCDLPVLPALAAGAIAGLAAGSVVAWLTQRVYRMGLGMWLGPFFAANAVACWVALG